MSDPSSTEGRLPWDGQPYSIKRHGVTITNCDREPVHTPGCIQGHGVLLVLRPADRIIVQASENTETLLGAAPDELLGGGVAAAIGVEAEDRLRGFLASEPTDRNPLRVMTLPASRERPPLELTAHTIDGVVILELEPSAPREEGEPDYYALVRTTTARLRATRTLAELCDVICRDVRALTGLDRVMVYKFHHDDHGEVVAEDKRAELPAWKGLHYPSDDIPRPARRIFERIWVRPVLDVSAPLAEIRPLLDPETGAPLDLTHCALRGASIMYTEYLRNMRVTASLTMSLREEGRLWGLIACHHYEHAARVPYALRAACEIVAQVASLQLQWVAERDRMARRMQMEIKHNELVGRAAAAGDPTALLRDAPALLEGLGAGGAALCHGGRWWTVGNTPTATELDELADWLRTRTQWRAPVRPIYVTDSLAREYPAGAAFADRASGVLALPLSHAQQSMMVWFRPETIHTVDWGGNPHDKPTVVGPHGPRLTPRASFELFRESVHQRSLPWQPVEVEAAARLRVLVMELVVGHDELRMFSHATQHDLREPVRSIRSYAHQLLEEAAVLDDEHRRRLDALVRLTRRMDSLLDSLLTLSRMARVSLRIEDVSLDEVLAEAVEMVDPGRFDGEVELVVPRPLGSARCDRGRVRDVLVGLMSNALTYNREARKRVELGVIAPGEDHPRPGCPEGSAGHAIYYVRDNGIGIAPEHHERVFGMFRRLHGREEYGGGAGAGLTVIARIVARHGGRIWLDSAPGRGTTVYFTLPVEEGGT
ncbi:ATP-binding protein [Paraliomyxa miuraensis]|uniref:ATP-binding protein n=1 Tax=Paraliomyxa miuraensis TaxID=376150 RepID=UPI002259EA10|nr:ATP-binding protein [Paraliomyxa miuraensis]MCX4247078.1 GAF domain-containing protein [Paraliomyxa miuraensis]